MQAQLAVTINTMASNIKCLLHYTGSMDRAYAYGPGDSSTGSTTADSGDILRDK